MKGGKEKRIITLPLFGGRKLAITFLVLGMIALAVSTLAYFSAVSRAQGNKVNMALLDLEVTNEDGSALLPLDVSNVYPGWRGSICGKITNKGTADLLMRMQSGAGNADYERLSKAMNYEVQIKNGSGSTVYSKSGYLDQFNGDNRTMNNIINPGSFLTYSIEVSISEDMDDHTTSENEDDNAYQGLAAQFDLAVQSTQPGNIGWNGF